MAVGRFGALIALMAYKLPGVDAALGDIACLKLPRVAAGSKVLPNAAGEVVAVKGGEDDVRIELWPKKSSKLQADKQPRRQRTHRVIYRCRKLAPAA